MLSKESFLYLIEEQRSFRTSVESNGFDTFLIIQSYSKYQFVLRYIDFEGMHIPHIVFFLTVYKMGYW